MLDGKEDETLRRPAGATATVTIEVKPTAKPQARPPLADQRVSRPVINSDQLAARVTMRRLSPGRSQRKYVLLLGQRADGTGISRRAVGTRMLV